MLKPVTAAKLHKKNSEGWQKGNSAASVWGAGPVAYLSIVPKYLHQNDMCVFIRS
jgi:hypothetical protein